jgi:SAM-dependent methyltransferase
VLEAAARLTVDDLTATAVRELAYADLVALGPVDNTPPGGAATVDSWIRHATIGPESRILDLACSTGFSSRRIAGLTGARAVGIDIAERPVLEARARSDSQGLAGACRYLTADAARMPFEDASFSHVVAGCTFAFIADREAALDEAARVLEPGGRLCIATFAYARTPPASMLDAVERELGFRPRPERTPAFWDSFFRRRFRRAFEEPIPLPVATERDVRMSAARAALAAAGGVDPRLAEVRAALRERLAAAWLTLNEHRRYQAGILSVWRRP